VGKLPNEMLRGFLKKLDIRDEAVVLGPQVGEDAAVLRPGRGLLVANTDPITFASDLVGWYAVHINANDVATMGAVPRWFLASALLPEGSAPAQAEAVFDQLVSACASLDITLVGGHTEIARGFQHPVVVGFMLGEVAESALITSSGARPGDEIVLTKAIAIEGTALLAREAELALVALGLGPDFIQGAKDCLFSPGISVVRDALTACSRADVNCMHDPTEGGLSTALREIAEAAGVGILVEEEMVPVLPQCRDICRGLGLDPWGLVSSGSLVITLPPSQVSGLVGALAEAGIEARGIGRVVERERGLKVSTGGRTRELPRFQRDELARFLESVPKPPGPSRSPGLKKNKGG
jgi:hydrogenase maturation factor